MLEFPWTYDQFQRYSVLKACIEVLFPDNPPRVLDVGGTAPDRRGEACWLPVHKIARIEAYVVDIISCPGERFIQGDGRKLPFKDNSFDLVSCLDVLEHIEEADREGLLQELCRVSRDVVLLANPFDDREIEKAEQVVFDQVKSLAGVEHEQLKEHKAFGLPDKTGVSEALNKYIRFGAEFSFGSLENWLFLLSLKYSFWYKADKEKIHELLDRFMTSRLNSLEFESPFYRHYWLYSHKRSTPDLVVVAEEVKAKLRDNIPRESLLEGLPKFNRELVRAFYPESVSAVVVTTDKGINFDKCLNHLLTQEVDFNLQAAVLDLSKSQDLKYRLKAFFPGVLYLSSGQDDKVNISLLKAAVGLKGDYVLLLSEDVFLPANSVQSFYIKLKKDAGYNLLSPVVLAGDGTEQVKFWVSRKQRKRWKKKRKTYKRESSQKPFHWIESECLFFKKSALFKQENKYPLKRENIFLWGSDSKPLDVVYFDEFSVHRE